MRRALIINTAFLGDVVFSLPLVENLGRAGYAVDLLTRPRYGALAQGLTGFEEAIEYDKRGLHAGPRALLRLGRRLRGRYDLVLGAHPSLRSGALAQLIGAHKSFGWGPVGYRERVRRGPRFVEDGLALGMAAGVPIEVRRSRLAVSTPGGSAVAIVPGARWMTKRWPIRHWQALADRVRASGRGVLFVGGQEEAALATALGPGERLFGAPLRATAEALAGCAVAIGGDSGLVHLARAAGVPTVVLFGPTAAERHVPDPLRFDLMLDDLPCRPCSPHGPTRCPLGHHRCLEGLGVDAVWQGLQRALSERHWRTTPPRGS